MKILKNLFIAFFAIAIAITNFVALGTSDVTSSDNKCSTEIANKNTEAKLKSFPQKTNSKLPC